MPFGNLGTIWSEMGLDIRKLDAGLMKAQLKLAGADKTITSWGQKLTNQSTKLIAVGGLMATAVAGVGIATTKMAADFEKSMRNVNSISKLSEQQFKKQADEVLSLSTRVPQSAKVLADGLYDIASSGFAGADGMKVLEASAKAASAGLTETATSAKGITAVLNAYALSADEAGKVSDTMFRTVDKGVITFEELSNTVGEFVGIGKIANLSFDELSGALGYITTKGVDASSAGVSLNRVILALIDPSEEMAVALKNAGYESGETALQQLGLIGVMDLLSKSTGGSLTELQKLFPEMRALRGASALLSSGIDDLNTYMLDFKDTVGATDIALAEQSKSLDYNLQILKNNISAVGIALGSELIPSVTKYTQKLSDYISKNKEAIADNILLALKIGGVTSAVLILMGILGKLRLLWASHPIAAIIAGYAILGTVIDAGSKKLEEQESSWSKAGASILRSTNLISGSKGATNAFKEFGLMLEGLKNGQITWDEALKANAHNTGELTKKVLEAKDKEEELKNGIYDSLEAFKSAQIYIRNYSDELPNATNEMAYLIQQLQNGELSTEAFTLAIEKLREQTDNGRRDIELSTTTYDQFADIQDLARIKVEAHTKAQQEAQGIIDDTTGLIDEQAKSIEELTQEFSDLIDKIFGITNAENALQESEWALEDAQKAVTEATKEHGEGSRETEQAINDYERELQNNLLILQELYNEEGISIERKEELRQKLFELMQQARETSDISQEKFVEMATKFGLSADEIMVMIGELGYELTELEKERIIKIKAETEQAQRDLVGLKYLLDQIQSKSVTITTSYAYSTVKPPGMSMGDIVKAYAGGGVIGSDGAYQPIMTAASGLNIPQTGRAVPIMAHEYEVIANTSQQKNLADWYWNFINNPPQIKGSNVPIEIRIPIELDGRIIGEKVAKFIYDGSQTKLRLGG